MREDDLLKVFGFDHPDLGRLEPPDHTKCLYCDEPILEGEQGFSMMHIGERVACRIFEHRECFLRGIYGSVAHIEHRCSCYVKGATCTDPEGMTLREAAREAVRVYHKAILYEEKSELYDVAKKVCHEQGMPWTDPRSGITYPPPSKVKPS